MQGGNTCLRVLKPGTRVSIKMHNAVRELDEAHEEARICLRERSCLISDILYALLFAIVGNSLYPPQVEDLGPTNRSTAGPQHFGRQGGVVRA
jgi:hypothetical protein